MTTAAPPTDPRFVRAAFEKVEGRDAQAPRLNKYDPGSLLGYVVYLLESKQETELNKAAQRVRSISKSVSDAWQERSNR